jgi:hypothetical protein
MPRITNITQLERAMKDLQNVFVEQQNTDVSISRGKFKDWSDTGYGNKTLLFQSLYTKGIPIAELAKWLSPTQNQGQVRNAVVKINDISYVQGMIGARANPIEDFKRILKQGADLGTANAYAGSIRFWWNNQGGNEQRVVRRPSTRTTRTTTPSEPTTTNGGTTAITEGVLDSCYQIIKVFHASTQVWINNRTEPLSAIELARAWDSFLVRTLLNPNYSLLVNPVTNNVSRELSFWSTRSDIQKIMLQKFSFIILLQLNRFTRLAIFKLANSDINFLEQVKNTFGSQNTVMDLIRALEQKHPNFRERVKFNINESKYLEFIYGNTSAPAIQPSTRTTPTPTPTPTTSERATNVRNRDVAFTNTFGVEIEYHNAPPEKIISECKKVGITVANVGYTHAITDYWKLVTDGSVWGTNGLEFVSPILRGNKGFVTLRKALTAVTKAGMFANNTAGTHIHFGAKDFKLQTWKNVLINYQGFQPLIDKYCAKYRESNHLKADGNVNHYIEPTGNITNWKQKVENAMSFRDLQLMMLKHKNMPTDRGWEWENRRDGRYFNVNLFAYPKQGTIEFRQLGSSIEFDMIQNWILFLHYLIAISEKKALTNFTFKGLADILPQSVSTYWHNRIFDLSTPYNLTPQDIYTPYEDRS